MDPPHGFVWTVEFLLPSTKLLKTKILSILDLLHNAHRGDYRTRNHLTLWKPSWTQLWPQQNPYILRLPFLSLPLSNTMNIWKLHQLALKLYLLHATPLRTFQFYICYGNYLTISYISLIPSHLLIILSQSPSQLDFSQLLHIISKKYAIQSTLSCKETTIRCQFCALAQIMVLSYSNRIFSPRTSHQILR